MKIIHKVITQINDDETPIIETHALAIRRVLEGFPGKTFKPQQTMFLNNFEFVVTFLEERSSSALSI